MATKPPRLGTTEDIPRAVEFLVILVLRSICFMLAAGFGLLASVAWIKAWAWWPVPTILGVIFFACGCAFRPRGKIVFDRVGPSVIVPKPPE